MPKLPEGKRVNVWIPPKQMQTAKQIDNLSKFFQICLDNAPSIMAWAMLRKVEPETYRPTHRMRQVVRKFNKAYPPDPLTEKRLNKNGTRTISRNAPSSQESNPALQ